MNSAVGFPGQAYKTSYPGCLFQPVLLLRVQLGRFAVSKGHLLISLRFLSDYDTLGRMRLTASDDRVCTHDSCSLATVRSGPHGLRYVPALLVQK